MGHWINLWKKLLIKCDIYICYFPPSTKTSLRLMSAYDNCCILNLFSVILMMLYRLTKIILGIKIKLNLTNFEHNILFDGELKSLNSLKFPYPTASVSCRQKPSIWSSLESARFFSRSVLINSQNFCEFLPTSRLTKLKLSSFNWLL